MTVFAGKEQDYNDAQQEMRALIEPVQKQIDALGIQLQSLNTVVQESNNNNFAPIVNILDNSHPEWSKAAYLATGVDPTTVSDENTESYNWFRTPRADIALVKAAADALKSSGHTLYAAEEGANENVPRWDRVNGQVELGGESEHWDLIYPLPNNLVSPGMVFYFQCEAMLRTINPPPQNQKLFVEFFDYTPGQEKIIEGGNFEISGEIFRAAGEPVGAETVRYQVKSKNDSGEEAISNILEFNNAPAVFSQNHHPRINLNGAPGYIEFEIYREKAGVFVHQFTVKNSIDSTYFDVGNPEIAVVADFPSLTGTPPRAYARTSTFAPGTLSGTGFVRHSLTIFVPTTYNKSLTGAGQQALRIGLSELCDDPRQIVLRRFGLSQGEGQWARSSTDQQDSVHSTPSTSPVSAPSGGSGGGVSEPPPFGGGGYDCVLVESKINVIGANGFDKIPLEELAGREDFFVDSASAIHGRVKKITFGHASRIIRIKTANNREIGATFEEPFITGGTDTYGTPAGKLLKRFERGEKVTVLTKPDNVIEETEIVSMEVEYGSFKVGITQQEGSHILIANDFLIDNRKYDYDQFYLIMA